MQLPTPLHPYQQFLHASWSSFNKAVMQPPAASLLVLHAASPECRMAFNHYAISFSSALAHRCLS